MKIAIVGAGVAGSVLARGLSSVPGVEVFCLEKINPGEHAHAGTGLNIGPNAVQALTTVDPTLAQAIDDVSYSWASWRTSLLEGQELSNLSLKSVAPVDGWRLRWSELYRVLRDAAGPAIQYACDITAIVPQTDGTGRLSVSYLENGDPKEITDIDILIAADGRFSKIRTQFRGAINARQVGVGIFRLLVPDTSGGLIDDYEQWFNGPNRLLGYKVPDDHVYMSGTFPIPVGSDLTEDMKSRGNLRRLFTPDNGKLSEQGTWLVDLICDESVELHWARLQESPLYLREDDVNVLYLGDSSNGMVPTLGQGATQAIESACAALTLIRTFAATGQYDAKLWLKAITQARQDRLRFVMDFSLEASDTLLAGSDPVLGALDKTQAPFLEKLAQLYNDFQLPKERQDAKLTSSPTA